MRNSSAILQHKDRNGAFNIHDSSDFPTENEYIYN
uniref:Uncharacterized protein n=1 Tax=Arundo donax TaxID=35708 RepID=A0A0A9UCW1_ARUDO